MITISIQFSIYFTEELSYKEKKEKDLKKNSSWHNWNTLFLAPGAVADLLAEQMDISKHDVSIAYHFYQ